MTSFLGKDIERYLSSLDVNKKFLLAFRCCEFRKVESSFDECYFGQGQLDIAYGYLLN